MSVFIFNCFVFLHSCIPALLAPQHICWILAYKSVINVPSIVVFVNRDAMLSKPDQSSPQASSLQSEVTEVEKDLTLRCLLWESLQEWQGLVDQWEATPFETLKIDEVQQDVTRFIQTVFLLEKGTLLLAYTEFSVTGKD